MVNFVPVEHGTRVESQCDKWDNSMKSLKNAIQKQKGNDGLRAEDLMIPIKSKTWYYFHLLWDRTHHEPDAPEIYRTAPFHTGPPHFSRVGAPSIAISTAAISM